MHICVVTPEFNFGGIGYYASALASKLHEQGLRITVITRGTPFCTSVTTSKGSTVYQVATPPLYPFHVWLHGLYVNPVLASISPKIDIIHCHSPVVPMLRTPLPILTTIHSLYRAFITFKMKYFPRNTLTSPHSLAELMQVALLSQLEQQTFNQSTIITSVSQANIQYLNQYHLIGKKTMVIGNGVDTTLFTPPQNTASTMRNIIFVGRLTWEKGLTRLLHCAEQILSEYTDVRFLLAGEGPIREYIEQRVRNQQLQGRIICLGRLPRSDLIQLYRHAYLQIIPSILEGLPNVLLEAMACGVPVLATPVGGIPDVIISGKNGILIPQNHIETFTQHIKQLLDNPTQRNRLSRAARRTIETSFTWDIVAERLVQCFLDIL